MSYVAEYQYSNNWRRFLSSLSWVHRLHAQLNMLASLGPAPLSPTGERKGCNIFLAIQIVETKLRTCVSKLREMLKRNITLTCAICHWSLPKIISMSFKQLEPVLFPHMLAWCKHLYQCASVLVKNTFILNRKTLNALQTVKCQMFKNQFCFSLMGETTDVWQVARQEIYR